MNWTLRYSKRALRDVELLRSAGLGKNVRRLIEILIRNPYQNPPPFEKLTRELKGKFSRRINLQHRLIYEIVKDENTVNILQMWTRYE